MISLTVIFTILIGHFIADFILQSDWMAINKSKDNVPLAFHCLVYADIMFFMACILFYKEIVGHNWIMPFSWLAINTLLHFITDYFTSRINADLWKNGKRHWFFVNIGFDQLIHYTTLILTYYYLKS